MNPSLPMTPPNFDLVLDYFRMMRAHGGIRELYASFPMLPGSDVPPDFDEIEREHASTEGAIRSMTPEERHDPDLLIDERRRMRVAAGSGLPMNRLNELIAQLYGVRTMLRKLDWSEFRRRFPWNPEEY